MNTTPEQIERKVLIPQPLSYSNNSLYRRVLIIDAMLLCILDKTKNKRGYAHQCVWTHPFNCIPLQFWNPIPDTYDTSAQFSDSEEVCQPRHKTLVKRCHELHNTTRREPCTSERLSLIKGQALQIGIATTESDRST